MTKQDVTSRLTPDRHTHLFTAICLAAGLEMGFLLHTGSERLEAGCDYDALNYDQMHDFAQLIELMSGSIEYTFILLLLCLTWIRFNTNISC